jgi:esterase/lipase superfamily enzyme
MTSIAQRIKMAEAILRTNDESMLKTIHQLLSNNHYKKSLHKFIKGYNQEIDDAVDRIKKGKYYSQGAVDKLLEEWEKRK